MGEPAVRDTHPRFAAVAKAFDVMCGVDPGSRETLRDAILDYVAGLPQEAVRPAIIEFFAEVQILDDILMEECGYCTTGP
jgi:hypothetical protein